ncbi:helix-turn-helix domain-containing protein [Streptomyces cellulosae]|uniref:helix-turn-helix domain-containing protein n=1 Tax=Streptomyces cellulosae TaxID=1968 RepID=UPI00224EE7D8|nr:helix-turn-helix domain-containing protein [Streptomyces cellulosae]WTC60925.1 helix-turn-helix domain-containing protein [Streptomyces cellulosae]
MSTDDQVEEPVGTGSPAYVYGQKLKELSERLGLSQNKLSDALHVSSSVVSRRFRGQRSVPRSFHDGLLALLARSQVEVTQKELDDLERLRASYLAEGNSPHLEVMRMKERMATAAKEAVANPAVQVSKKPSDVWSATPRGLVLPYLLYASLAPMLFPLFCAMSVAVLRASWQAGEFRGARILLVPLFVVGILGVLLFLLAVGVERCVRLLELAPHRKRGKWHFFAVVAASLMATGWALTGIFVPEAHGFLNILADLAAQYEGTPALSR